MPEQLTRPMTLCPECRSPLESIVPPSADHLPKVSEVLHTSQSEQTQLDVLYLNCEVIGTGASLPEFSDTVTSPYQLRDVIFTPFRAANTALNLGMFAGYMVTCVGLSVGAGIISGAAGLGRQLKNTVYRQEPEPPISQVTKSGASWMFKKLSWVYNAIPYESTQLPLPVLTYLGLSYLDQKLFHRPIGQRREVYRDISEYMYQICTPYQVVTDSTVAIFRYTERCFTE